jgi:hypothetical protein
MEDYYFLLGKEGNTTRFKESFEDAKRDLGINELEHYNNILFKRINNLEDSVINDIFLEKAKEIIKKFLRDNPDVQTGQITNSFYGKGYSNFLKIALDRAFNLLEATGEIVATSQGRGKQRTWRIKEV